MNSQLEAYAARDPETVPFRRVLFFASGLIVAAAFAVYFNTFRGPFVLDDYRSIVENASIRRLSALNAVLSPPDTAGVGGRPFANLTFALNYAISGLDVWSYHALNFLLHSAAALALYGVVRRTLLQPALRDRFGSSAASLALAVAALWTLHPLQTQAVSYLSQRTEVLMGLCYLLMLYCFIRGAAASSHRWYAASVFFAALGMASKEVMVTAPLLVLGYDRTFCADSWRDVWRRRGRLHLGLASTWLLLAYLIHLSPLNQRAVGYGHGVSGVDYALSECRAIAHYAGLIPWPNPLIFDHGANLIQRLTDAAPYALILAGLLAGTLIALRRRPPVGFCAAGFFLILAPTSTVVPVTGQPIAESRVYLPSAPVLALAVVGAYALLGRRSLTLGCAAAVALALLTVRRNEDYRTPITLWTDTIAKQPDNPRAYCYLGLALDEKGRRTEALVQFEKAAALAPAYGEGRGALGNALRRLGRFEEAAVHLREAVRLNPREPVPPANLGATLLGLGQWPAAVDALQSALKLRPDMAEAHLNLGAALFSLKRLEESAAEFQAALRLDPGRTMAHRGLAGIKLATGQVTEAVRHAEIAARLEPDTVNFYSLGQVVRRTAQPADAIAHYEKALSLNQDYFPAHDALGSLLIQLGRHAEAAVHSTTAVRLKPDSAGSYNNLGIALRHLDRLPEAIAAGREAIRLRPESWETHLNLGLALYHSERYAEAVAEYREATRLRPDHPEVHFQLANALTQSDRLEQAVVEYEAALRLKPDFTTAALNLAKVRSALAEKSAAKD